VTATRLLVVCHANVARSVAAAYLLSGAVDERGEVIEVRSAGTHATEGQPVSGRTASALAVALGSGVSLGSHRAHQLGASDLEQADLVVAMEAAQVRAIRRQHPGAAPKVATLAHLARALPSERHPLATRVASMALGECEPDDLDDVVDPAGGDDTDYVRTMRSLMPLCANLTQRLEC
jgi:protein-tyrosine-phosphatase